MGYIFLNNIIHVIYIYIHVFFVFSGFSANGLYSHFNLYRKQSLTVLQITHINGDNMR